MRSRTVAATVLLGAALAGCSSSSHDDKADPSPTSSTPAAATASTSSTPSAVTRTTPATDGKADLVAAVKAYSTAYFAPDPDKARSLLSKRCQAKADPTSYAAALKGAVAQYGHQDVTAVTVDSLSGDLARVSYTYSVPALNQRQQPWTREGGAWRYDAC